MDKMNEALQRIKEALDTGKSSPESEWSKNKNGN